MRRTRSSVIPFRPKTKNRATRTDEPTAFRAGLHINQRQAPPGSRPFIQPAAIPNQFTDKTFLGAFAQRQPPLPTFDNHTTQIPGGTRQTSLVLFARNSSLITAAQHPSFAQQAASRPDQPQFPFLLRPNIITHTNHREIIRVEQLNSRTLHTKTRRRDSPERPATLPTRKHIRVRARTRKRTKRNTRHHQQKLVPFFRRITQIIILESFVFDFRFRARRTPEHLFSITLIHRRQQLIRPAIRQPLRTRRHRREHPTSPIRHTNTIRRDQPILIHGPRQQPAHRHTHTHTTITPTNIPLRNRHHTTPRKRIHRTPRLRRFIPSHINILKLIRRISPPRINPPTKLRKRRRHTTHRLTFHHRSRRSRKRRNSTILHPTMFTFIRFHHQPIHIHPPRFQPHHITMNPIILFFQTLPFHTPPRPKQTRNNSSPNKPTLPNINFFTQIFKTTLRHFKILLSNNTPHPFFLTRNPPHNTTQHHRPQTTTITHHTTRHRTRKNAPPPNTSTTEPPSSQISSTFSTFSHTVTYNNPPAPTATPRPAPSLLKEFASKNTPFDGPET